MRRGLFDGRVMKSFIKRTLRNRSSVTTFDVIKWKILKNDRETQLFVCFVRSRFRMRRKLPRSNKYNTRSTTTNNRLINFEPSVGVYTRVAAAGSAPVPGRENAFEF